MLIPKLSNYELIVKLRALGSIYIEPKKALNEKEIQTLVLNHDKLIVGMNNTTNKIENIIQLLNNGILNVATNSSNLNELFNAIPELGCRRIFIKVDIDTNDDDDIIKLVEATKMHCGGYVLITNVKNNFDKIEKIVSNLWLEHLKKNSFKNQIIIDIQNTENIKQLEEFVGKMHKINNDYPVHIQYQIESVYENQHQNLDEFSAGRCFANCLKESDRKDGLFATVVADEHNKALGMVYSSFESICTSIELQRGVYYSRSRQELWKKGETSGAIQQLLSAKLDCDNDALLFSVIQKGDPPAFCHKSVRNCWGEDSGISHLFNTLENRKINAPPKSYTKRLFNDKNLLKNKLLEEAQELSEALEEGDKQHVVEETADVIYFALVACAAGDGNLKEVCQELDKRSLKVKRRPGNAKQYRIDNAAKLLNKKQKI